jgi:hypothetical protein
MEVLKVKNKLNNNEEVMDNKYSLNLQISIYIERNKNKIK